MRKTIAERKQAYVTKLFTYKVRREELRTKLNVNPLLRRKSYVIPKEYYIAVKNLNSKILIWSKGLKRIDKTIAKLKILEKTVTNFTGTRIKGITINNELLKTAKNLYYKYGLEHKFRGRDLTDFIQVHYRQEATRYRTRFTASWENKPENKQLYLNFKTYYETRNNPKPGK